MGRCLRNPGYVLSLFVLHSAPPIASFSCNLANPWYKSTNHMQRPAAVNTFGILNIVFAALAVFGTIASLAVFSMTDASNNPLVKVLRDNPAYGAWLKFTIVLGLVAAAVLLAAGIGLLRLQPWGRKVSIGYAIYAILFSLLNTVISFLFVLRPLLAEAAQKQGPEAAGAIGGVIGGSVGSCFGLIYPILLLIFMTRPKVVAAFERPAEPPVGLPPV